MKRKNQPATPITNKQQSTSTSTTTVVNGRKQKHSPPVSFIQNQNTVSKAQ
jgi:hypothetical protein